MIRGFRYHIRKQIMVKSYRHVSNHVIIYWSVTGSHFWVTSNQTFWKFEDFLAWIQTKVWYLLVQTNLKSKELSKTITAITKDLQGYKLLTITNTTINHIYGLHDSTTIKPPREISFIHEQTCNINNIY